VLRARAARARAREHPQPAAERERRRGAGATLPFAAAAAAAPLQQHTVRLLTVTLPAAGTLGVLSAERAEGPRRARG
jgi:hypothetical protein